MFGMLPFDRTDNNVFDTFDNFARDFFRKNNADLPAFRTDIRDTGDSYLLEAELPGFNKEDIQLSLDNGVLTITAHHQENLEEKNEKEHYLCRERHYGSYQRSFSISGIEESAITASYENGVLKLTLPKETPVVPAARQISIQ